MKVAEVRELPDEEIVARLDEVKEELFNLKFQNATGQLENYKRLGMLKKDVAKIETVLRERELGIEPPPEERPEPKARRRRRETTDETSPEEESEEPVKRPRARARRRLRRTESEETLVEEEAPDVEAEDLGEEE